MVFFGCKKRFKQLCATLIALLFMRLFYSKDIYSIRDFIGGAETQNSSLEDYSPRPKNVLVFPKNSFHGRLFSGNARKKCRLNFDCDFSQIKQQVKTLSKYDLIVIGENEGVDRMVKKIHKHQYAKERRKDQIWAFIATEPSTRLEKFDGFRDKELQNALNWTIFASHKATINYPFFITKAATPSSIQKSELITSELKSRKKDVCWIFSDCIVDQSGRQGFVKEFLAHYEGNFHVWGKGLQECMKQRGIKEKVVDHGYLEGKREDVHAPQQRIIQDCKFYFALENSYCEGYISEKVYNSVEGGAIPIMNGWRESCDKQLPKGSFIHVSDFESISNLTKYIERLVKNENEMLAYHKWRQTARLEQSEIETVCKICNKLKELDYRKAMGMKTEPEIIENPYETIINLQTCI
ncbi:4-galactosyl-N-acetylglucosaminide 3-alpha-L-fucosyltransferase 9-like [Symsagittifera roscoffensis]|uniref:4-galactosyl-N-acetylglucosaminide 3-alpha-L-fucosyltransferase 9-like n=1 Tax=Symsagittifera roscoffensis TaxID=84072 RepID=UPI00307C7810